jgi:hypothetical protein
MKEKIFEQEFVSFFLSSPSLALFQEFLFVKKKDKILAECV